MNLFCGIFLFIVAFVLSFLAIGPALLALRDWWVGRTR